MKHPPSSFSSLTIFLPGHKMVLYLVIISFLLISFPFDRAYANHGTHTEDYQEQLIVRSLAQGQVSAYFQFRTFVPTDLGEPYGINAGQHSDLFPLSLLRLLHHHEVQELRLSLTKGMWKHELWGPSPREVPPNAHLSVWFSSYLNAPANWKKLTSFLSGQFCASINLIKPTVTIRPKASYRPFVRQHNYSHAKELDVSQEYGYLAALPQEAICTENLTPWTKLLPCQNKKGLGQLLVATNIFNSKFISLSLDFKFTCADINSCSETTGIELKQNILVVFAAPMVLDGRYSWSLNSLFNNPIQSYCPLSSSSHVYVEASHLFDSDANSSQLTVEPSRYVRFTANDKQFSLKIEKSPPSSTTSSGTHEAIYADYDFKQLFEQMWKSSPDNRKQSLNLGIQYSNTNQVPRLPGSVGFSPVQVRRHLRGYGVSNGGISATITNNLPYKVNAIYLDMIPWHFRMYLHTMICEARSLDNLIDGESWRVKPSWLHYEPAQDRVRPHHLEMYFELPARSQIEIRFEFENQFLRWTEYPPDANHGLYISPASVTFFLPKNSSQFELYLPYFFTHLLSNHTTTQTYLDSVAGNILDKLSHFFPLRLYTEPILISMPTPDFSMPYNVVCLVSTVLSIAFGPIYNLTTRRTTLLRKQLEEKKKDGEGGEANKPKKRKCIIM